MPELNADDSWLEVYGHSAPFSRWCLQQAPELLAPPPPALLSDFDALGCSKRYLSMLRRLWAWKCYRQDYCAWVNLRFEPPDAAVWDDVLDVVAILKIVYGGVTLKIVDEHAGWTVVVCPP